MSKARELIQNLTPEQRRSLVRSLASLIAKKDEQKERLQSLRSIK